MATNSDLKIGDRVLLSPTSRHANKGSTHPLHNPINVLGTVVSIHLDMVTPACRVVWDNGEWDYYHTCDDDLLLQHIGDPDSHTLNTMRW